MPKFPGPYTNEVNQDDPIMRRVPQDKAGIGSRSSGMPSGMSNSMDIEHIGGSTNGTLPRR